MPEKPVIAARKPMAVELDAGDYFWCACGSTGNQPMCDGTHKGSPFRPVKFALEEGKQVYLCMCRQTKNPPFCDGTHATLPADEGFSDDLE